MTTAAGTPAQHAVARAVARLHEALDEVTDAPLWSMNPTEAAQVLTELSRVTARQAELTMRVAAHAEAVEVGADVGATSTANWWAHQTRQTRAQVSRTLHLAHAVGDRFEKVRAGLAAGEVNVAQAEVIVHALDQLPADLDPDIPAQAEQMLVEHAATYDPIALRALGRGILAVVAPEIGEAHEARILEREEAAALLAARLTMTDDGHGKCHGRFTLPTAHGAMLKKQLMAIAAPKHQTAKHGALPPRRPGPERMGRAFMEYIERYPTTKLPKAGGLAANAVVTMTAETLLGGLKAARLDTGEAISPSLARRLACEAGIIPIVLGSKSQILDVGRENRFHTPKQRIAIAVRDKTCTAVGCDWPPAMCHVHHDTPFSEGGATNVDDGRLLCPRHHARAHDPTYTMTRLLTGKVEFHRRT